MKSSGSWGIAAINDIQFEQLGHIRIRVSRHRLELCPGRAVHIMGDVLKNEAIRGLPGVVIVDDDAKVKDHLGF
jgi:hypothetical protein